MHVLVHSVTSAYPCFYGFSFDGVKENKCVNCNLLSAYMMKIALCNIQGATGFAGAGITLEAKVERPVMQA